MTKLKPLNTTPTVDRRNTQQTIRMIEKPIRRLGNGTTRLPGVIINGEGFETQPDRLPDKKDK